jgi:peptidoglycan/xylan/chitin deacetylase (PgdA/CDA1 family)
MSKKPKGNVERKATVCLTVDFDAVSIWMTWGATGNRAMSRGEFGGDVGAPRVLDLFERLGVTSTWFIPGHTVDSYPEVVKRVHAAGHEIGNHGYAHEQFDKLSPEQVRDVVSRGNAAIERITKKKTVGMRVPAGDFDGSLLRLLAELGFEYDSSMVGEFFPSWARDKDELNFTGPNRLGKRLDLVELPLSFVMNDFCYFEFNYGNPLLTGSSDPDHVYRIWSQQFDYMYENVEGGILNLTLHPQSIGWGLRITMLERFIEHCKSRPGTRFVTCADASREFREAAALRQTAAQ